MWQYIKKVLYITSYGRKRLASLILFFLVASLLEAFGISLIGPFLGIVSNPSVVFENSITSGFFESIGARSDRSVVLISGILLIIVFCFKTALYFASKTYIIWYSFYQKSALEVRLIDSYLQLPYTFHLQRNSAEMMQNITSGSNQFAVNCLIPLLELISGATVSVVLLLLLAKTDILFLILMFLVLLPILFFVIFLGKIQTRWGAKQTINQKDIIKSVNHALGGLKETKVIGCESYFSQNLREHSEDFFYYATRSNSSQMAPRVLLEGMLLIVVISYILVSFLVKGSGITELISVMGVFAGASIRLVPASSQISQSIVRLQSKSYLLDLLYADLKQVEKWKKTESSFKHREVTESDPTVQIQDGDVFIENLTFYYPNTSKPAIDNISLSIKKGTSVALVGKSGSGKTTLVDILLGLLFPQSGDIKVDGVSVYKDLAGWRSRLGYIPQSIFLLDATVASNIAYGVPKHLVDQEQLMSAVKAAQLEDVVESLPEGLETFVGERGVRLSGGQRQRIGIARALYHNCEILILDEATSALDTETETLISDAISALAGSKTLIIIAHRYSTIRDCDVIYRLNQGRVVQVGSYDDVVLAESSAE